MQNKKKVQLFFTLVLVISIVSGCSIPTSGFVFNTVSEEPQHATVDASDIIKLAMNTQVHSELTQKFWFNGWVRNYVQKRKTTSMFSGSMIAPHGYYADVRMSGVPYRYYKWDDANYIWTNQSDWLRVESEQFPFAPFAGFEWWQPFLDKATQLPNEEVLSKVCSVYEIEVDGKDWIEKSGSPIFVDLQNLIEDTPGADSIIQQTKVTMKIWIGNESFSRENLLELANKKGIDTKDEGAFTKWIQDNYFVFDETNKQYKHHKIFQYSTLIQMPIPGAGYMDQETFFRLYKYDDPGISIKTPKEMEQYLK